MTIGTMAFAGSQLDRADHIRSDPAQLDALMDWRARLLRLDGLDPVIAPDSTLEWGTLADAAPDSELVFLGLIGGRGCFAEVAASLHGSVAPANPRLWAAMTALGAEELATYGTARSLVDWHARHRYCARCGNPTLLAKGGWQRNCTSEVCKAEHFPRVDPVTIMLVEHEDQLLLAASRAFRRAAFRRLPGLSSQAKASRRPWPARCWKRLAWSFPASPMSAASLGRSPPA